MIRDWAGTDSSSDDVAELSSAGPGDGLRSSGEGSGCGAWSGDLAGTDAMGRDERRRRSLVRDANPTPGRGDAGAPVISRKTVVLVDVFRVTNGRIDE